MIGTDSMSRGKMKKKLEITVGLISHICVTLEDIYDFGDINRASENGGNIEKNIKIQLNIACLYTNRSIVNHILMMNFQ